MGSLKLNMTIVEILLTVWNYQSCYNYMIYAKTTGDVKYLPNINSLDINWSGFLWLTSFHINFEEVH